MIRLIDRTQEDSVLQPLRLKIDPGSQGTGMTLVQDKEIIDTGTDEIIRHVKVLNLMELQHWVDTTMAWIKRLQRWAPLTALSYEQVRFDMQKLQNPAITGIEYQQGTLFGYEVREYLLEKWKRSCAYCKAVDVPLEVEHIQPKSKGGSDRVSNLTLACRHCNQQKGNQPIEQFLANKPDVLKRVLAQTKAPLRDAACVGTVSAVTHIHRPTLLIQCTSRDSYQRTRLTRHGFPRSYLMRQKQVHGFQTDDRVKAILPSGKKVGTHIGRVAVRQIGSFNIQTQTGVIQGIGHKYCQLLQRGDGYGYHLIAQHKMEEARDRVV